MNIEHNKILAALLVAGITACAAGFASRVVVHSEKLEKNAFEIEAAASTEAGAAPAAATGPEPIDDLMASADVAHGEKISKVCSSCHSLAAGEPNRIGPNLHGVVGRAHGAASGYAYSDAMKATGGVWDVEHLNAFLWKPQKTVPGTKMTFAGLKKPEDRAAIIKWLQSQK